MTYATFGNYIVFKELAADALGRLCRAGELDRNGLGRVVWLRIFDGAAVPRGDLLEQLTTARRVGDVLQAANVAAGPRYFDVDGVPALATDHVSAQPLSRVFEAAHHEGFPVPVDNALLILEKIALGLAAALTVEVGGNALVHGCLHPGLVLVSNDGEAQVSAFGVADQLLGVLDDAAAAAELAPYLAPEVLVTRTASKRGDVYSLGAVLYHLLTGRPLAADPAERSGAVADAELAYDDSPVPDDIKALLNRALATRAEERFSSAADFKKELDKLLYGGAYSPTTFNLALFMDRLFRSDIEAEEKERMAEKELDPAPYLAPEPEPEAAAGAPAPRGGGRGPLIGIAVAAVAVAIVAVVMLNRSPPAPPPPATPTAEEVAARKQADDERLQMLVQQLVQERMAEKELEIRSELETRQARIDELQRQLRESQQRSTAGRATAAEARQQAEIERQLAAAEAEQRRQQEALEAERQRLLEESRKQLEAQRAATATAVAEEESEQRVAAVAAVETATPPAAAPAAAPTATPTATAAPAARVAATATTAVGEPVRENQFVEPELVDVAPVVLREAPVTWPRQALRSSRRGMTIVRALVNADGAVEDVEVLRADHDGFGIPQAVTAAVREYRFRPGEKDGVIVKTWATVTVRYWFRDR